MTGRDAADNVAAVITRRHFLHGLGTAVGALAAAGAEEGAPPAFLRAFSLDGHAVRLSCSRVTAGFRLCFMADTHLFRDDARGEDFRRYSARMAAAYHRNQHFLTGTKITPEEGFTDALRAATAMKAARVVLGGDILSFPSEAGVEWTLAELKRAGLPWHYTAGNHDWHYEGMDGSSAELRATWCRERLRPLYREDDPLMAVHEVNGVRLVMIDNSTYEILPGQLEFFRRQVATGQPLILFVHIPLYAAGRGVGFGCGHPAWGAGSDEGHKIERRPRWRESGHTMATFDFHREAFAAPNLLGIFAGHIHRPSIDVIGGVPQCVAAANANGGYLKIEVVPS